MNFKRLKKIVFQFLDGNDPVKYRGELNDSIVAAELQKDAQLLITQKQLQVVNAAELKLTGFIEDLKLLGLKQAQSETLLTEKLVAAEIYTINNLTQLFLPDEQAQHFIGLEKKINAELMGLQKLLNSLSKELAEEMERNLTTELAEDLSLKLESIDLSISQLNQEIGILKGLLEQDNRLKLKYADLAAQIEVQKKGIP